MIRLRPATLADAAFLLRLRNDPATRASSRNRDAIDPIAHGQWLSRKLDDPSVQIHIAEWAGGPVGTIRLEGRELSWTVAPERRGQGLGGAMLQMATALMGPPLIADIRSDNPASRRIAEQTGFRLEAETDGLCRYVLDGPGA